MNKNISAYNSAQIEEWKPICSLLEKTINQNFPKTNTENKLWHGAPVWFIDGNPIVGYSARKNCVQLLFWSGQSFEEPGLIPTGSFKAAEARYTDSDQIKEKDIKRWIKKSKLIQWDYKNIIKRKGKLVRLNK